jgi:hypothetical protein
MGNELKKENENEAAPRWPEIAVHFGAIAAEHSREPIGALVQLLATGTLDPEALKAHVRRHGVAREDWYQRQVTDLGIAFIIHCLDDGPLGAEKLAEIHALNAYLELDSGAYFKLRPVEVAAILGARMDRILDDDVITSEEELDQVELQAAFCLGYDQYLALVRSSLERSYLTLQRKSGGTGPSAEQARRNLSAIEAIYRLATSRARSPGALY